MGEIYGAICNACEAKFEVSEGSGMYSMPFHCNVCGKDWDWEFAQEKGEFIEDGSGTEEIPQKDVSPEEQNDKDVWTLLREKPNPPLCECGGTFDVSAPPRCPNCRSADFRRDPDGRMILWD